MELSLFEEVADALRGLVPRELGQLRHRAHRGGVKVWFDADRPPREHYEVQILSRDGIEDAEGLAVEIGFHAEHPRVPENDAVIERLRAREATWRPTVGDDAVVGPFLGRPDVWRRISETWPDPDFSDADLSTELALRLADYITALEPARRAG